MKSGINESSKENAKVLAREAQKLADNGKTSAAINKYRQACKLNNAVAGWHERLARLLDRHDDIEEALIENTMAIKLQEHPPGGWLAHQGDLLAKSGSVDEAVLAYELAIKCSDVNANWYAKYAQLLYRAGSIGRAIESYKKAIHLDDSNPAWHAEISFLAGLSNDGETDLSGITFTKERGEDWYNTVYQMSDEYQQSYRDSVYHKVWMKIIKSIKKGNFRNILEIGCGSGQLAQAIADHVSNVRYLGIDFSETAIKLAKHNCPAFNFKVTNALNKDVYLLENFDLVISTEVLEHIESDLELMSLISGGIHFIGTVPDFDSYSHVRYFKNTKEVRMRYAPFLAKFKIEEIPLKMGCIFLISGIRNNHRNA